MTKTLNPKLAMTRLGHKLGHAVRGGSDTPEGLTAEAAAAAAKGHGDQDEPSPALGAMTIDRVVEQLFFVRVSVYNAKGRLSEPQQVSKKAACFSSKGVDVKIRSSSNRPRIHEVSNDGWDSGGEPLAAHYAGTRGVGIGRSGRERRPLWLLNQ